MKTIGLLGGMSWESTTGYYRAINHGIKTVLGGLHSAKIAMYSVDFHAIAQMQRAGDWPGMASVLSEAARSVEAAGADFLLICTNTMHKVAPEVENTIGIPLLHIADAAAEAVVRNGFKTVGLLGTSFTMEDSFFKDRLTKKHGIEVIVPNEGDRGFVHRVIFGELCLGEARGESKSGYLRIIEELASRGAQAVILGCTEIGMLISDTDTEVPLFDTTVIHAAKAVECALEDDGRPGK